MVLFSFFCVNTLLAADGLWTQKADIGGGAGEIMPSVFLSATKAT